MGALIASVVFALICCLAIFVLARRADRRLARFRRIPWQFGMGGEPTYFGPRRLFFYFTPCLGAVLIILMGLSLTVLPANGNPAVAFLSVGASILAAQLLLIWLVEPWARTQR
ncbi:MAG: hypothetical protein GW855_05585 [Erythrobacter sp.]|nr:hypothetical protein [Erythrobacter sp.]NCQ62875.1 hypothetical protein [Alphaproteobacteria bacterium]